MSLSPEQGKVYGIKDAVDISIRTGAYPIRASSVKRMLQYNSFIKVFTLVLCGSNPVVDACTEFYL